MNAPAPVTQLQIDQRVFDLYDEYCHGRIDRREFLARSAALGADMRAGVPYYEAAAKLSWDRTIAHFKKNLA